MRSSPAPLYLNKTDILAAELNAGILIELQAPTTGVAAATTVIVTPSDVRIGIIFGDATIAATAFVDCSGAELGRIVARVPGQAGQGSSTPTAVTHVWLIAAVTAKEDVSLNEVA